MSKMAAVASDQSFNIRPITVMSKIDQPLNSPNQMILEAVVHLRINNTQDLAILSKLNLLQRVFCRRR